MGWYLMVGAVAVLIHSGNFKTRSKTASDGFSREIRQRGTGIVRQQMIALATMQFEKIKGHDSQAVVAPYVKLARSRLRRQLLIRTALG